MIDGDQDSERIKSLDIVMCPLLSFPCTVAFPAIRLNGASAECAINVCWMPVPPLGPPPNSRTAPAEVAGIRDNQVGLFNVVSVTLIEVIGTKSYIVSVTFIYFFGS